MKKVKDYIKNIDFELVDDDGVLDNVYAEIQGFEGKLIVDIETSHNMEQLIKKSNSTQIINMLKSVCIVQTINKKIGSRVFETVFNSLFLLTYKKRAVDNMEDIHDTLLKPIYDNLEEILSNRNGTHVLRKYFEYVYAVKQKDGHKDKLLRGHKDKLFRILDQDLDKEGLITIIAYLKLDYSKRIARKIIDRYLTYENIKSPHYSFIFEDMVEVGDRKTVERISTFIESNLEEVVSDRYANYVVSKTITKLPDKSEAFYSLLDLKSLNSNSNIVLRLLENFCKQGHVENIKRVLLEFYHIGEGDSVFHSLLMANSEGLNTKFVDCVRYLIDLDGDILNVNSDLVEYFDGSWLNKKCGIKLVKSFLEGGATNKTKKRLISKLNISSSLLRKKEGVKISNLVKTLKRTRG